MVRLRILGKTSLKVCVRHEPNEDRMSGQEVCINKDMRSEYSVIWEVPMIGA